MNLNHGWVPRYVTFQSRTHQVAKTILDSLFECEIDDKIRLVNFIV